MLRRDSERLYAEALAADTACQKASCHRSDCNGFLCLDALDTAILAERERLEAMLRDPAAVYVNVLRGTIDASSVTGAERERLAKFGEALAASEPTQPSYEAKVAYRQALTDYAAAIRKGAP